MEEELGPQKGHRVECKQLLLRSHVAIPTKTTASIHHLYKAPKDIFRNILRLEHILQLQAVSDSGTLNIKLQFEI